MSTPTCPGSKTSINLFQCPHDCFTETDVTEDTIEEMDEDDLDSLNKLVRQGLDIGTDRSSYRQVKFIIIEERKDPLQLAIFAIFLLFLYEYEISNVLQNPMNNEYGHAYYDVYSHTNSNFLNLKSALFV